MRIFKSRKKAVIEVGFSWIFILIAGGVILGLFSYIAVQQGSFFKTLISANLLTDLDAIFVGAQVSRNTAAVFEIPQTRMQFSCTSYSIDGLANPLTGRFVFAPQQLHTNELLTWSKSWSLGFRITNFLYITSPYIKYYVVYTEDMESLAQDIYNDLPARLAKEKIMVDNSFHPLQGEEIINQNYDRIHVMVLQRASVDPGYNTEPTQVSQSLYDSSKFRSYRKDEIQFIHVRSYTDSLRAGRTDTFDIAFTNKEQAGYEFPGGDGPRYWQTVYDISAVYGAFISGNPDVFQCTMERAFAKAGDVVQVYDTRRSLLSGPNCHYSQSAPAFTSMVETLHDNRIDIDVVGTQIRALQSENERLERISCPLLY